LASQYVGLHLKPIHNSLFSLDTHRKSNVLSFIFYLFIYESKDAKTSKTFDALDWLAQLVTHIPNKGEHMVRYYGFYSNKSRGLRKKAGTDDQVPVLIDSDISRKAFRKNWERLIQKIYNIDPSLCLKYLKPIKIIFFYRG
jgi:hypothetical protein